MRSPVWCWVYHSCIHNWELMYLRKHHVLWCVLCQRVVMESWVYVWELIDVCVQWKSISQVNESWIYTLFIILTSSRWSARNDTMIITSLSQALHLLYSISKGCFYDYKEVFFSFLLSLSSGSDSQAGAAGLGPGGGPDSSQPRFSSSLPTYLPVQCQLSGADSAFFLREANQEVMRNGSLSSRTEPFFLHQLEPGVAAPHSLPNVNCSYGNLSAEQPIPVELLQGPPPHLLTTTNQVTLNWKVKGQVVVPKVGSTRPWIQVTGGSVFSLLTHKC